MVRLVFRPYTQISRTICTSVSLGSSTLVSQGFNLSKHSSHIFRVHCNVLYLTPLENISWAADAAGCPSHLILTFITPMGLAPADSHMALTPWSVFQDGSIIAVSTESQKPLRSRYASLLGFSPEGKENRSSY